MTTKNEIIKAFAKELDALTKKGWFDDEEKPEKPYTLDTDTDEVHTFSPHNEKSKDPVVIKGPPPAAYNRSPNAPAPISKRPVPDAIPEDSDWVRDFGGLPKPPSPQEYKNLSQRDSVEDADVSSGKSEWDFVDLSERDVGSSFEDDAGNPETPDYQYNPNEYSEPKYSDEDYFRMAEEEPEHVVTNLMLQHTPPFNQVQYIYPLMRSLVSWLQEINYKPEKDSMLHNEIEYMLGILEKDAKTKQDEE